MDYEKAKQRIIARFDYWALDKEDVEALQTLLPELSESDDERVRKGLINFLQSPFIKENLTDEKVAPWIAYLEKQKEQQPIEKPINWTELTWKDINELEGIINKVHYEFRNGIGEESFGKEVLERFREYKGDEYLDEIEQKPAGWSESFEENIRILLNDKLTWHSDDGSMSSTVLIDGKTLKDIISGIWFYVGKEALKYPNKELKVSVWSEEDRKMVNTIISDGSRGVEFDA